MKSINRLIRISCYYNRIKFADFYNLYSNPRTKSSRAIVYTILYNDLNYSIYDISKMFKKSTQFITDILDYHKSEYNLINHYTKLYENTITQYDNWDKSGIDLAYSIIKTKYDYDLEIKYEQILNDNNRLSNEIENLKIILNKKSYV
tara:strand:+ start:3637 stop:4077 length:441 start_codon:yes stop_codon:yes gene_type:complete